LKPIQRFSKPFQIA